MDSFLPPPKGDRNRGIQIIIVTALFDALAGITVLLRLYVKIRLVKKMKLGLDDLCIVLGYVSYAVLAFGFGSIDRSLKLHSCSARSR